MKAVIVEIRGDTAAALGRDGSVFKVKNRAYAIGQTIHVRRVVLSRQLAVLAACAGTFLLARQKEVIDEQGLEIIEIEINRNLAFQATISFGHIPAIHTIQRLEAIWRKLQTENLDTQKRLN